MGRSVLRCHEQLLKTSPEELRAFADEMEAFAREGAVCVVGNPAALPEEMEIMEL